MGSVYRVIVENVLNHRLKGKQVERFVIDVQYFDLVGMFRDVDGLFVQQSYKPRVAEGVKAMPV